MDRAGIGILIMVLGVVTFLALLFSGHAGWEILFTYMPIGALVLLIGVVLALEIADAVDIATVALALAVAVLVPITADCAPGGSPVGWLLFETASLLFIFGTACAAIFYGVRRIWRLHGRITSAIIVVGICAAGVALTLAFSGNIVTNGCDCMDCTPNPNFAVVIAPLTVPVTLIWLLICARRILGSRHVETKRNARHAKKHKLEE